MCSDSIKEGTIGDSWTYSWELLIHLLNCCSKILWCDCIDLWWCSEFNLSYHYDYVCQIFTKGLMWWTILYHHQSKINIIASILIARFQYQPLTKAIFYRPEICRNILNMSLGGNKTTKIAALNKLIYINIHCIDRYSGVWLPWSCVGKFLPWFHRRPGSWNAVYLKWGNWYLSLSLYTCYLWLI